MIPNDSNLKNCLIYKGWKVSRTKPPNFKAGYPFFDGYYRVAMIATGMDEFYIIYCDHFTNTCNGKMQNNKIDYFYL